MITLIKSAIKSDLFEAGADAVTTSPYTVVPLLVIDPENPENLQIRLDVLRDALNSVEAAGQFGDGFDVDGLLNEIGRTTEAFLGEQGGVGAGGFDLSSVGELGSALGLSSLVPSKPAGDIVERIWIEATAEFGI